MTNNKTNCNSQRWLPITQHTVKTKRDLMLYIPVVWIIVKLVLFTYWKCKLVVIVSLHTSDNFLPHRIYSWRQLLLIFLRTCSRFVYHQAQDVWVTSWVCNCSSECHVNNSLGSTWQSGMKDYLAIQAAK